MRLLLSTLIVFLLGIAVGTSVERVKAAENVDKPAYLIVSSDRMPDADYGPYLQAAGPLARNAGLQMLASAKEPVLLEGNWPYNNIAVEVYPSMETLMNFWYSDEYQEAKKLREGLSRVNFIVAVEGD